MVDVKAGLKYTDGFHHLFAKFVLQLFGIALSSSAGLVLIVINFHWVCRVYSEMVSLYIFEESMYIVVPTFGFVCTFRPVVAFYF